MSSDNDTSVAEPGGGRRGERKWLREILAPLRPTITETVFTSFFINLLALAVPIFVLQVYDRVVFYSGISTLQGLAIGMLIAIAFDFVLRQFRSRLLQRIALRFDLELGRKLFDKLAAVPLRILETRPSAYWQALHRDAEVIRNTYSGASAVLVTDLPFALLFLAFLFVIAMPVAWVLVVMLPIFVLMAWRAAAVINQANEAERPVLFKRDALITDFVVGRTTIKSLAAAPAIRPAWEERHTSAIENAIVRGARTDRFINLSAGLTVFTIVIITSVGALAIIDQKLTIGALIAANILSFRIVSPFQQLVANWRNFIAARSASQRLGEAFALAEDRQQDALTSARPKGRIVLENVSFSYNEDAKPAIESLNIKVGPGGLVGIVGPNGSGKSTLLKLIQGLYAPTEGRVLLDDADITQFSRRQLAEWIGYVPQECILFDGSIRENLTYRNPAASDDEVIRATMLSGVHAHIADLPDGYETNIGEAGGRLSAGIKQRIVIARAVIGDPPILLMDEPSSNLDTQAQSELKEALAALQREHTILLVTHSPLLLEICQNVMMVEHGRITRAGPVNQIFPNLQFAGPRPSVVRSRS